MVNKLMRTSLMLVAAVMVSGWLPLVESHFQGPAAWAQETSDPNGDPVQPPETGAAEPGAAEPGAAEPGAEGTPKTVEEVKKAAGELAKKMDESERAKEISAGILKPIYDLAELMSFPAFHWLAFAVMVGGVVSFALQLVLGKLIVLSKFGFSLMEILSDAFGLVISLVGLVLTTQAAAENSTFTSSPAAVISATAVGALVGLVFYFSGQAQEVQAVEGRRAAAKQDS